MSKEPAKFITTEQMLAQVGVSYPTVIKQMKNGTFPRSRKVGKRSLWIEEEVSEWIRSRPPSKFPSEQRARAKKGGA
jgi:predicted DNA-binding transcriptional regulator AlpA